MAAGAGAWLNLVGPAAPRTKPAMAREHTISADSAHPGASFRVAVAATAAGQRDVTFVENHGQVVAALIVSGGDREGGGHGLRLLRNHQYGAV